MTTNRNNGVIVSSSGGVDVNGKHIVTPVSVISYVNGPAPRIDNTIYKSKAVDSVHFLVNPLLTRSVRNIALPVQRIFDHVPMSPALIRHWLVSEDNLLSAICFPRSPFDLESLNPSMQILKHASASTWNAGMKEIQTDLTLLLFRREISSSAGLQLFDPDVWHPVSYEAWLRLYTVFAPVLEEELQANGNARLPNDSCTLFRRMMHTHYTDVGMVFGRMWWAFGLGRMVDETIYCFMRGMLMDMFITYNTGTPSPALPPFFNAVTVGSGQRICANCMVFRLGQGQMKRCPCQQVYYCSAECQKANWKVHRFVCLKK